MDRVGHGCFSGRDRTSSGIRVDRTRQPPPRCGRARAAKSPLAVAARRSQWRSGRPVLRSCVAIHATPLLGTDRSGLLARCLAANRMRRGLRDRDVSPRSHQLRADLLDADLSKKRINNILAVLSKALKYAVDCEVIGKVPRSGCSKPSRRRSRGHFRQAGRDRRATSRRSRG